MRSTALLFVASMIALAAGLRRQDLRRRQPRRRRVQRPGSSSSGGSSGSSSGGGSSSSGSGRAAAAAPTCSAAPGCTSAVECPAPTGCGGSCYCDGGEWECADPGCGRRRGGRRAPRSSETCPPNPPPPGTACFEDGFELRLRRQRRGQRRRILRLRHGSWECVAPPLPAPDLSQRCAPTGHCDCADIGSSCDYTMQRVLRAVRLRSVRLVVVLHGTCSDAGAPDTGSEDASSVCPVFQPQDGQACSDESAVCSYFDGSGVRDATASARAPAGCARRSRGAERRVPRGAARSLARLFRGKPRAPSGASTPGVSVH